MLPRTCTYKCCQKNVVERNFLAFNMQSKYQTECAYHQHQQKPLAEKRSTKETHRKGERNTCNGMHTKDVFTLRSPFQIQHSAWSNYYENIFCHITWRRLLRWLNHSGSHGSIFPHLPGNLYHVCCTSVWWSLLLAPLPKTTHIQLLSTQAGRWGCRKPCAGSL